MENPTRSRNGRHDPLWRNEGASPDVLCPVTSTKSLTLVRPRRCHLSRFLTEAARRMGRFCRVPVVSRIGAARCILSASFHSSSSQASPTVGPLPSPPSASATDAAAHAAPRCPRYGTLPSQAPLDSPQARSSGPNGNRRGVRSRGGEGVSGAGGKGWQSLRVNQGEPWSNMLQPDLISTSEEWQSCANAALRPCVRAGTGRFPSSRVGLSVPNRFNRRQVGENGKPFEVSDNPPPAPDSDAALDPWDQLRALHPDKSEANIGSALAEARALLQDVGNERLVDVASDLLKDSTW
jgi:hypothetical protein